MAEDDARPVSITISGEFSPTELAALLALLRKMNGANDKRHWTIDVVDTTGTLAEAEALLARFFPDVSTHERQ